MNRLNLKITGWDDFIASVDGNTQIGESVAGLSKPCSSPEDAERILGQFLTSVHECVLDGAPYLASSILRTAFIFARVNQHTLPSVAVLRLLDMIRSLEYVLFQVDQHPESKARIQHENRVFRLLSVGYARLLQDPDTVDRGELKMIFHRTRSYDIGVKT